MKNKNANILAVLVILGAILIALLIEVNIKPIAGDKKPVIEGENEEEINKSENISDITPSINTGVNFSENSKIKKYIYKNTLLNYTTTVYVKNNTYGGKAYFIIEAEDNPKKEELEYTKYNGVHVTDVKCPPCESEEHSIYLNRTLFIDSKTKNIKVITAPFFTMFKKENNTIYKKIIPSKGGFEENYRCLYCDENMPDMMFFADFLSQDNESIKRKVDITDIIFSFDILYFQDLRNVEKLNLTGIRNEKVIESRCNENESEEVYTNDMAGSRKRIVYNCTTLYNASYVEKANDKIILNTSWIDTEKCMTSNLKNECIDSWEHGSHFEKMYFAGTENLNGKIAYKIVYEKFKCLDMGPIINEKDIENNTERDILPSVGSFWIDKEEGIILKANVKTSMSYGSPDDLKTINEIVLSQ